MLQIIKLSKSKYIISLIIILLLSTTLATNIASGSVDLYNDYLMKGKVSLSCGGIGTGGGGDDEDYEMIIEAHGDYAGAVNSEITMRADGPTGSIMIETQYGYVPLNDMGTGLPTMVCWGWDFGDGTKAVGVGGDRYAFMDRFGEITEHFGPNGPDSNIIVDAKDIVTHKYESPGRYTVTVFYGPMCDVWYFMGFYPDDPGDKDPFNTTFFPGGENAYSYKYFFDPYKYIKMDTTRVFVGVRPPDSYFHPLNSESKYLVLKIDEPMIDQFEFEGDLKDFPLSEILRLGIPDKGKGIDEDVFSGIKDAYVYLDGDPDKYYYNYAPDPWDYIEAERVYGYWQDYPNYQEMTINEKYTYIDPYRSVEEPSEPITNEGGYIAFHDFDHNGYYQFKGWYKVTTVNQGMQQHYWITTDANSQKNIYMHQSRFKLASSFKNENLMNMMVKSSGGPFTDLGILAEENEIITINVNIKNPYPIPDHYGCWQNGVPCYNLTHKVKGTVFLDVLENPSIEIIDVPESAHLIKDGKAVKIDVNLNPEKEMDLTLTAKIVSEEPGSICLSSGALKIGGAPAAYNENIGIYLSDMISVNNHNLLDPEIYSVDPDPDDSGDTDDNDDGSSYSPPDDDYNPPDDEDGPGDAIDPDDNDGNANDDSDDSEPPSDDADSDESDSEDEEQQDPEQMTWLEKLIEKIRSIIDNIKEILQPEQ